MDDFNFHNFFGLVREFGETWAVQSSSVGNGIEVSRGVIQGPRWDFLYYPYLLLSYLCSSQSRENMLVWLGLWAALESGSLRVFLWRVPNEEVGISVKRCICGHEMVNSWKLEWFEWELPGTGLAFKYLWIGLMPLELRGFSGGISEDFRYLTHSPSPVPTLDPSSRALLLWLERNLTTLDMFHPFVTLSPARYVTDYLGHSGRHFSTLQNSIAPNLAGTFHWLHFRTSFYENGLHVQLLTWTINYASNSNISLRRQVTGSALYSRTSNNLIFSSLRCIGMM